MKATRPEVRDERADAAVDRDRARLRLHAIVGEMRRVCELATASGYYVSAAIAGAATPIDDEDLTAVAAYHNVAATVNHTDPARPFAVARVGDLAVMGPVRASEVAP